MPGRIVERWLTLLRLGRPIPKDSWEVDRGDWLGEEGPDHRGRPDCDVVLYETAVSYPPRHHHVLRRPPGTSGVCDRHDGRS